MRNSQPQNYIFFPKLITNFKRIYTIIAVVSIIIRNFAPKLNKMHVIIHQKVTKTAKKYHIEENVQNKNLW